MKNVYSINNKFMPIAGLTKVSFFGNYDNKWTGIKTLKNLSGDPGLSFAWTTKNHAEGFRRRRD